jgi:hypothetical protein
MTKAHYMIFTFTFLIVIVVVVYFFRHSPNSPQYQADAEAISTPASLTQTPINKCEVKQGWYYGSINDKKPGTPNDWFHQNEGSRSAKWRATHEPRGITAEEEAECGIITK